MMPQDGLEISQGHSLSPQHGISNIFSFICLSCGTTAMTHKFQKWAKPYKKKSTLTHFNFKFKYSIRSPWAAFQLPHDSSKTKHMHNPHNLRSSLHVTQLHPEIKRVVKNTITAVAISHPDMREITTDLHEMLIYPFCECLLLYFVTLI